MKHLPRQLLGRHPFEGDIHVSRIPLFSHQKRPTLPFPHPGNFRLGLRILESCYWDTDDQNRYMEVPGFAPLFITRDPDVIRAIMTETGEQVGKFHRDNMPSMGIARASSKDNLLLANGPLWKQQKKRAAPAFSRGNLFQVEQFEAFEDTFRNTVRKRLDVLNRHLAEHEEPPIIKLDTEIKAIMLELLVVNFLGADIAYEVLRDEYMQALVAVNEFIVMDTVFNLVNIPIHRLPSLLPGVRQAKAAHEKLENLTRIIMDARQSGRGQWQRFSTKDMDETRLFFNIKVILAGALEATTSLASWAIWHLARDPASQALIYEEVKAIESYTPEALSQCRHLHCVLQETLRLTPAFYFLPRIATGEIEIETLSSQKLKLPQGTHVLLDLWHANHLEAHWGERATGSPAYRFSPRRWLDLTPQKQNSENLLHFGFGHGPRFCPGKNLGELEISLVVGAFVKLFTFEPVDQTDPYDDLISHVHTGISTQPKDEVALRLKLRESLPSCNSFR